MIEERARPENAAQASDGSRKWLKTLSLIAWTGYIVLVTAGVLTHEPWSDEAQAWLLARDAGPWELFSHLLRSEGSPGLWHAILLLPAKLGLPYRSINVISGTLGAAAAYLVLWRSPFPWPVRLLLPFSFFLSYQYAVVARNYALLPLLIFSIALSYPQRDLRPFRFALLVALLANVSAQAMVIASCLAAVHSLHLLKEQKTLARPMLAKHVGALAFLTVVLGLTVLQLINSENVHFANKPLRLDLQAFKTTSVILLRESAAGSGWISLIVAFIGLWWFWRTRVLSLYLIPTFGLLLFSSIVYSNAWHEGIPFLVWLLALWVSLEKHRAEKTGGAKAPGVEASALKGSTKGALPRGQGVLDHWSRIAVAASTSALALVQIGWAVNAFSFDLKEPYSGSRGAAAYIKAHSFEDQIIYGVGFPAIALLPYFESNIYQNLNGGRNPSFWDWTSRDQADDHLATVLENRPDVVVQAVGTLALNGSHKALPGYRPVACLPGGVSWKYGPREAEAYLILVRESGTTLPEFVPKTGPSIGPGCMASG